MGIADDVARQKMAATTPLCKLGQIVANLIVGDDLIALQYAIARAREEAALPQNRRVFTTSFIHRLLNDNGYDIGATTVKDHLARKCACDDS